MGQTNKYVTTDIGFLAVDNYYGFCGGTGLLELKIIDIKINKNRVKIKGQLIDNVIDDHLILYDIFVAENDTLNNQLKKIRTLVSKQEIDKLKKKDFNGIFKVNVKLRENERIYFSLIGYSMIELKILTSNK
jgi:hypothetical protein